MTGPAQGDDGATAALGRWLAGLADGQVPGPVREHLALGLLDTLACGVFGASKPWGRIAAEVAAAQGAGTVPLWGGRVTAGPAAAAMANGTAVHGFELDDVHLTGQIHPGSVVVPAVLSLAETAVVSGRTALTAIAAGYEVGIRLGMAAGRGHGLSGYHPTGTIGAIAAAAGCARLLGLDAARCADAVALGATQAAGLYAARRGGMVKRYHAGHAAQSGVLAAMLAARGFTAAGDAIEAPFGGLCSTLGFDGDLDAALAELGETWHAAQTGFKIYATCASAQTIVDGILRLRAAGVTAALLTRLDIHASSIAVSNVGWPYVPRDATAAQMNGSYAAAVSLLDGDAFVAQYDEARFADPEILRLAGRVTFHADPAIDAGGPTLRHATRLVAHLADGTTREILTEQRPGGPGREIPREAVVEKARRLIEPGLGAPAAATLEALALGVDTVPNARSIGRAAARDAPERREQPEVHSDAPTA